jgi:Bacterial regulatory proteins, gntR family/TIR domain
MKIFISWSGTTSRQLAQVLREWLPTVLQTVKPYFSPDDLEKGTRWSSEVSAALSESNIGLICVTPDNSIAPWIMFEAGALSKQLQIARVCPILFGMVPADVQGPLAQFQCTAFSKVEIRKLVIVLNDINIENTIDRAVLDTTFEAFWPQLQNSANEIMRNSSDPKRKHGRPERDLLEEILTDVRLMKQAFAAERGATEVQAAREVPPTFSPLYEQVKVLILRQIEEGEFAPGEAIPIEQELAARFKVSQGTIRKAVDTLCEDGFLVRRQGIGTFVSSR